METITSLQNPRLKRIVRLQQKSKERRQQGLIVVEGRRELDIALKNGFRISELYFSESLVSVDGLPVAGQTFAISQPAFEKLAYRENSDGIIALLEDPERKLADIKLSQLPLVIILESVEKPGNLGAVLRTADAVNADAVIISDPLTDIYNPNVIRSSVGCVFSRQVVACTNDEARQWLKGNGIASFAAELKTSENYLALNYNRPVAFVMGTEADGLSESWIRFANHRIKIPMLGDIDSLNVSVSTAVLVFEAMRQRNAE